MNKKTTYTFINQKGEIEHREKPGKKTKESRGLSSEYLSLGFYLAVPLLGGLALGIFLDRIFHKDNLFTLIFLIFGTISTFYNLYKLIKDEATH